MPVTTTIQIIITLAGQVEWHPPPQYLIGHQTIHLREVPSADSRAFTLRVSKGDNIRESQLSTAESTQLVTLLAQLPAHSMVSKVRSFDGISYNLVVNHTEQTLSFHWQNDDWRYASQTLLSKWKPVAAVADYALNLANKKGDTL